ncbi:MAG: SurA N-terminal domain-containing protein [Stagnimonas sp.]|nr:SurA N-terminal domain-containing protein [Stagnimonas sp.]
MLQSIRERLTGPVVWVVIGLIAIPFAFFGVETFQNSGGDPTVVKVGDQKITDAQVQAAYDQRLRQLQDMLGESFRADMIEPQRFREGVLQEMIQESTLRQHAKSAGYAAPDALLLTTLNTIPAFQKDGKFSKDAYLEALARQGLTPQAFETQLRDGLNIDQVRDSVLGSAFVTSAETASAWRLAKQERSFSYVSFSAAAYEPAVVVSEEDVRKFHAANAARYAAPERLKLQYLELSLEALPPAAAPEAAALKAVYDSDAARFSSPEERRASHILVNFGADKDAAEQKALALKARLDAGADFSALAREASDDPGSKSAGGDLGWVRRGLMTPKFEQTLFELKPSAVSAPVETEFGWHLIKLSETKPAVTKPFTDAGVQAELLSLYRQRDAEHRYQELADKLAQLAFESSASLEPVAKELNLPLQTTDWFARTGGAGIAANPEVLKAAFAPEILDGSENSKPVANGDGKQLVFRKAEYEPSRPRKLDEVAEQIRTELRLERARAQAAADADQLVKALKDGAVFEAAVAERHLTAVSPGSVRRDAENLDRKLLDALFKLPRPAASALQVGKATLENGDIAVLALGAVRDGTPMPEDPAFQREGTQLRDALAGAEFAGFRQGLEKSLGIDRKPVVAAPETP